MLTTCVLCVPLANKLRQFTVFAESVGMLAKIPDDLNEALLDGSARQGFSWRAPEEALAREAKQ